LRGVTFISGLRSLNLANQKVDDDWMGHGVMSAWASSLMGLTYLNMAKTIVRNNQFAALATFLPSPTHLDLNECTELTLLPTSYSPPLEASLKALTRLNLSSTP
jgi:hypothetical protein